MRLDVNFNPSPRVVGFEKICCRHTLYDHSSPLITRRTWEALYSDLLLASSFCKVFVECLMSSSSCIIIQIKLFCRESVLCFFFEKGRTICRQTDSSLGHLLYELHCDRRHEAALAKRSDHPKHKNNGLSVRLMTSDSILYRLLLCAL